MSHDHYVDPLDGDEGYLSALMEGDKRYNGYGATPSDQGCSPCSGRSATPGVGDGAAVLARVETFLSRFVAFPTEHCRVAVTLWTAHAHATDAFESTPRLALLSPEPGSGKTRVLEVLELLVPSAMHVLSASPAAIFRSIGKEPPPTLLFDEVDAIFGRHGKSDDHEDLRGLLNAGHRNGATIPRCVGPQHNVALFPVYAAAALAGLGDLPDTLMTRSVVIRMRRRRPAEQVEPFRYRVHAPAGEALRDQLAAWCAHVSIDLTEAWPEMPPGIEDRPADVWEPLLAVADAAGGTWPERARTACLALAGQAVTREASLGVRLLGDLRAVFNGADKMATVDILDELYRVEEAPWSDLRGRPLDARGLAFRLSQYEVGSRDVRLHDGRVLKGYYAQDLYDAWTRYLPAVAATDGGEPPITVNPSLEAEEATPLDLFPRSSAISATSATPQVNPPEAPF